MSGARIKEAGLMAYRVVGIVVGGYALWAAAAPLVGVGLHQLGLQLGDAMLTASLFGAFFYVGVLMWGFGAPQQHRPATALYALGALATVAALLFVPGGAA